MYIIKPGCKKNLTGVKNLTLNSIMENVHDEQHMEIEEEEEAELRGKEDTQLVAVWANEL